MKANDREGKVFCEVICALADGYRYIFNKGGTRSGKTYSTLQALMVLTTLKHNITITVTSETFPHLRLGCMRDFENIVGEWQAAERFDINKSNHTYTNNVTGSRIEFVSFADVGRAHGSQRDYLFVNECNNVSREIIDQLLVRTSKSVLLDYNPVCSFWCDQEIEPRDNCKVIHTTYLDNAHLSKAQVMEIESRKGNENWWRVYGLGECGMLENLVYTNFDLIPDNLIPTDVKAEYYGMDFGYTNDPTAVVWVGRIGDDLYIRQLCYRNGMQNPQIADLLRKEGVPHMANFVADSAEQKSIDEINRCGGYRIKPVTKGQGSILQGISILQRFKIHVAQSAVDVAKEFRTYSWQRDKNGNIENVPEDFMNHAMDAIRYVALTYLFDRGISRPRRVGKTTL